MGEQVIPAEIPVSPNSTNQLTPVEAPEPDIHYVYDERVVTDLKEEINALRDLFSRRLMEDRQKSELIQALKEGASFAFIEPFLSDLILLLDRVSQQNDDFANSVAEELLDILERRGVEVINVSDDFDPKLHKAIRVKENSEV